MADLLVNLTPDSRPNAGLDSYPITNAVALPIGSLVQTQSGFANHWDETGEFQGIAVNGDNANSSGIPVGDTSLSPDASISVDSSGLILTGLDNVAGTPAQAKVGNLVYCTTSNIADLTMSDTTNPPVGRLVRFTTTTDVDVQLFTPGEWLAGDAGTAWAS